MFLRRFTKRYREVSNKHNIPYTEFSALPKAVPITSIVIPSVGADFIAESVLSARFASINAKDAQEIIIVSDQPQEAFGELPERVRVVTLDIEAPNVNHAYAQIYKSRLLKIMAPLEATTDGVLMIDSDLNLLKSPHFMLSEGALYSCFRNGRMCAKFEKRGYSEVPAYYQSSIRPHLEKHVNSAFLAGTYFTFQRLCPLWRDLFIDTWEMIPDNQPPTDQPPLAVALDTLDLNTVNLGDFTNWPVSKIIGGKPSVIPSDVMGAHGGFPLSEWDKYLQNPASELTFRDQEYTRKVRYLSEEDKKTKLIS